MPYRSHQVSYWSTSSKAIGSSRARSSALKRCARWLLDEMWVRRWERSENLGFLGQRVHWRGIEAGSLLTTRSMGATAAMVW